MLLLSALRPNDPRYGKLPLPGSTVDASLRFAIACWPVADPLQRYQVKKAAGEERFVISHDKFWPSEADMAEGSPTLILDSWRIGREAAGADHARHRRRQSDTGHGGQFRRRLREGRRLDRQGNLPRSAARVHFGCAHRAGLAARARNDQGVRA